ncbi:MAG: hypothetical protein RMK99_10980, partial [Anaerolineales bacterium]|nr:hypothetical protein [Anaerolineales bacterium]
MLNGGCFAPDGDRELPFAAGFGRTSAILTDVSFVHLGGFVLGAPLSLPALIQGIQLLLGLLQTPLQGGFGGLMRVHAKVVRELAAPSPFGG